MAFELVLLVPVLVLLTVFVLWAGRGGRAALTADLAAEEAATAAALCCEDDVAGRGDREALVEDMLDARPGLGFLCIGGPRPNAPADDGGGSDEFLQEKWVDFEPGRDSGGVGVLGVRFLCETDGAVAPLRGLFPTVTFHGQAAEVVQSEPPPPGVRFDPVLVEAVEGEPLVFTVRIDRALTQDLEVAYVVDGPNTTAADAVDYVLPVPQEVTVPAGDTSAEISVTTLDEGRYEGNEELVLVLAPPLVPPDIAVLVPPEDPGYTATGVITDATDEPHLFLVAVDPVPPHVVEGGDAKFNVRLRDESNQRDAPSATLVTVDVVTVDSVGTDAATSGDDYVVLDASLSFNPGDVLEEVTVNTSEDLEPEPDETFDVVLQSASGADIERSRTTVTILDNEATVSVADAQAVEGDLLEFVLSVVWPDAGPTLDVGVMYKLSDLPAADQVGTGATRGTCGVGVDYEVPSATMVTIVYPATMETISVQTCDDTLVEPDEKFWLELLSVTEAVAVPAYPDNGAVGTIVDDDRPVIAVNDESAAEAPAGGTLTFTVNLETNGAPAELGEEVSVSYAIEESSPQSALAGVDYAAAPDPLDLTGTLVFGSGTAVPQTVTVDLLVDYEVEHDETFQLRLSDADTTDYLDLTEVVAIGTILDDPPPVLSVSDFTGPEGTTGSFTVTLDGARAGEIVEVDYVITGDEVAGNGDTATAIDDFRAPPPDPLDLWGTLTFAAGGAAVIEVPVELRGDYVPEGAETLRLTLTNPSGAVLFGSDRNNIISQIHATGTIEDDPPPVLSVSDFTGREGTTESFTVSLSDARDGDTVTVDYAIVGGTGDGWASAPGSLYPDFAAASDPLSGSLTFRVGVPGEGDVVARTVEVSLLHDGLTEDDEVLRLVLSDPSGAVLFDRDPNNSVDEPFGVGTITNVAPPWITVDNVAADEGLVVEFTVTVCNRRPGETVTVDFDTTNRNAEAGLDYEPESGTLTFDDSSPAAATDPAQVSQRCGAGGVVAQSRSVTVTTLSDAIAEVEERFHLLLSEHDDPLDPRPLNAVLDKGFGVGTINDVSVASVVVTNPAPAVEGDPLRFVIAVVDSKTGNPPMIVVPVSVRYRTADRTAEAGADYDPLGRTRITFNAGSDTHDVVVQTLTDTEDEDDETFALLLSNVSPHASIGDTEGTGTIEDRLPPRICIEDAPAVRESETAVFVVSLRDHDDSIRQGSCKGDLTTTSETVTVEYATGDRTAHAGLDYEQESGTVTFNSGENMQSITVLTSIDDIWEPSEEFRVDLHTPVNAILDRAVGTGTIRADCISYTDPEIPTWTLYERTIEEGSLDNIWASLDRPLCFPWSYEWMFVAVTATHADFHPAENHFARPKTFTRHAHVSADDRISLYVIFTVDDDLDEEDEEELTLRVRWVREPLDRYDGAPEMPGRFFVDNPWIEVRYTIRDNDPLPNVSIADAAAIAGESMTFEVSLDARSGRDVTVDYYTVDVTAEGNSVDYSSVPAATPGTVTIPAGWLSDTFTVQTESNTLGEHDETFHVVLTGASNANIDDGVGIGTILAQAGPSLSIADASASEGETMSFSVTLSEAAPHEVTVDYRTIERADAVNPATEGDDYVADSGPLTFSPGETGLFIDVDIETDDFDEPNETFRVELGNQTAGVSLADSVAIGTIQGNVECLDVISPGAESLPDYTGTVSAPSVSGHTGFSVREDSADITLTLSFDMPFCHGYHIVYDVVGGTAQRNADFVLGYYGIVQMVPLDPDVDIVIPIIDDDLAEGDEDVHLRIRGNTVGQIVKRFEEIFVGFDIVDDDVARIELPADGDTTTQEGRYLSFVVRLDRPTVETVTFDYVTRDGSAPAATEDVDYEPTRGSAEILPGELSVTIPVRTIEDVLYEHDENVELVISNLTGADPDPDGDVAVARIVDDDDPPAVRVSNPIADEGGVLVFEVTLDVPAGRDASVSYVTRDGPASGGADAGADYDSTAGPLVFAAGETAKTVSVQALDDGETEGEEIFFLDLSGPDLRYDKPTGTGTIRDRSVRRVSVSDAVADEGEALEFVVGIEGPPAGRDITVQYSTVAGTAEAGIDYDDAVESAPGTVRILAGTSSAVVRVKTEPDTLDEDLEQLTLVLSAPSAGAELAAGEAVGTILDDDAPPLLSIDDPEATENGDGTPITFTVSLSAVSGRDVSVHYSTVDSSALEGDDYVAAASPVGSPLVIPRGARSVEVPVTLVDDDVVEVHERFLMELSDPVNAEFGDTVGAGTILDDDGLIEILLDTPDPVYEGPGATVDFVVRLSRADPVDPVSFGNYMVGGSAMFNADFTTVTGRWTIDPGETDFTISVPLRDDDVVEDTETFVLGIGGASSNATISGIYYAATATILDDDGLPTLSVIDAPDADEGSTATFTVELSHTSTQEVTVAYAAVVDPLGGDAAAIPGQDFEAVTGTLTIPARSTSATVTVPLPDDALNEHVETFWLRLADPTGAGILDGTGVGRIVDDDPLPVLDIFDASATEGTPIRFAVTLDTVSGRTVTVPWTTAPSHTGDPASPTDDYGAESGTLTFPSGTTTVHIEIDTVDDEVSEADETFQVRLGEPSGAAVDDGVAVGAIIDDDGLPRIFIAGDELLETDSPAKFVVTLSHRSSQAVTVDYVTAEQTATAGDDYGTPDGEATGMVVIPAGLDRGEISVFVADDDIAEGTETFLITLSNAVNAVIAEGAGTAVGTILNDDVTSIAMRDAYAYAYEAYGTIEFPVTLSAASSQPVTVRYTTFDGSATQPNDYTAASDTLTIPAGTTTATISVILTDDTFVEDAESFLVRLSDPAGAELATDEAVGVIVDDDNLPSLNVDVPSWAIENDGSLTVEVILSHASDQDLTVPWYTDDWQSAPCPIPLVDEYGTVGHLSGNLVVPAGATAVSFTLQLHDNDIACANQLTGTRRYGSFQVNVGGSPWRRTSNRVFVWDDELSPYLKPLPTRVRVLESAGYAELGIGLNRVHDQDVTVTYFTAWSDDLISPASAYATLGVDFGVVSAAVTISAGSLEERIRLPIVDDTEVEPTEVFVMIMTSPMNADIVTTWTDRAYIFIIDDDVAASVSVADTTVEENAGRPAQFAVSLSRLTATDVTISYETVDGSASAGDDYVAASNSITIEAGTLSESVSIEILDDDVVEGDETFDLRLTAASGATLGSTLATAIIGDDDVDLPVISIGSRQTVESTGRLVFYPSIDRLSGVDVSVSVSFVGLGEEDDDNIWLDRETITIPAGQYSAGFIVLFDNDQRPEIDERFLVVLHDPVNAILGQAQAWGTIIDDDLPIVSVEEATLAEDQGAMVFTLRVHAPGIQSEASVRYATAVRPSAGESAAIPDQDYVHTLGEAEFPAGVTSVTVTVPIADDGHDEPDESFLLQLSNPVRLEMGDSSAVGTIVDDDPGWVIDDRSIREDDTRSMVFTVTRDHRDTSTVTVDYTVTGASAVGGSDCTAGVDYITPSGSVTLLPTETEATISVTVCEDDVAEGSETLFIELRGVPGRKLIGVGTIVDS